MRMLFKQRFFSWFDSYDIYDESGETLYTVKGELSWGHCLKIFDAHGSEIGVVKERVLTWLPKFEVYYQESYVGCISKEFSFLKPRYNIEFKGWEIEGDWLEWDYRILEDKKLVATVSKEVLRWTDTYVIDVNRDEDAIYALMFVLAIDAEKCSRN